jgi:hypothetical protein
MINKAQRRNGLIVRGQNGHVRVLAHPDAPNAVDLGEAVSILPSDNTLRDVRFILPEGTDTSGYSLFTLVWYADDAAGNPIRPAPAFSFAPTSGSIGSEEDVLGAASGRNPRYELLVTDTSGRMGFSRGLQTPTFGSITTLDVTTNPTLDDPVEGMPLTGETPVYTADDAATYSWVYQVAEDASGTNSDDIELPGDICPPITGAFTHIRRGALFTGLGTDGLEGPYWSGWDAIIPAEVVTPVTLASAAIIASNRIALTNVTATPLVRDTITSGAATATVVAYVSGTGSAGTLYTGPITGGSVMGGALVSWAGGSGTAIGDSAAWQITGGEPFYVAPPLFNGEPTENVLREEIATDSEGSGAILLELNGVIPPWHGSKYYRHTRRVAGYGITGTQDFSTAWTPIGIPTLSALADEDWFVDRTLDGSGTRVSAIWVRDDIFPSMVRWTTSTQASINANPYPIGHEIATSTNETQTVNGILYRKWTTSPAVYGGKDFAVFITPDDDTRRLRFGVVAEIGGGRTPLGNRKTIDYLGTTVGTSDTARLINRSYQQAVAGEAGGAGMQFPRSYAVDGDYVFKSYDVTFPNESVNFGGDWYGDEALGCFAGQSTEGAVAWGDKYVVAMMSNLFMKNLDASGSGNYGDKEGIYRKNRLTNQWSFVQALPNVYGSNDGGMRFQLRRVALVPGGGLETSTLFALSAPGASPTTIQVYKSTNSGATWATDGGTISAATHGTPLWFEADSTALYMATKTGVSRRPFGGTTWTQATGLPSGPTTKIQKVGNTIYVSVRENGLWTATDATTLAFTRLRAHNINDFSVCPTNSNRIILTGWWNGGGLYTGNGGSTWTTCPSQPYQGTPNLGAHRLEGPPAWVQFHDTDPNLAISMRQQHMGRSTQWPPVFEWASNNEDYSELRTIAFHRSDYRTFFLGMQDRLGCYCSHGAMFVMDDTITTANKEDIRALTGDTGALAVRGAILFDRGNRTGVMGQIGGNISQKVPVFFSRSVTTTRTDQADTGNGAVSVTASPDLPAGPYTLTCTTGGASAVFSGTAPFQESMGTWTVGTPKTFTHSRGGTLAVTISDGSVNFTAGANPAVITITVNPIGGAITITNPATKSPAWYGQVNPAIGYRGCSGRHIFEMATDGTISRIGGLDRDFVGYMGSTGAVILCYSSGSGEKTLWRGVSSDNGQSYTITSWATNVGNFVPRSQPLIKASAHNDQRAWVGLADGTAKRYQNGVGTVVFNFNTWRSLNGIAHGGWPGLLRDGVQTPGMCGIAESWQDENIVYASVYVIGGHYLLFKTENALAATPVWTDITRDDAGRGLLTPTQVMEISPLTGEVFLLSSHGSVMRRPPQAHRTTYNLPSLVSDLQAAPGGDYHITSKI